MHNNNVPSLYPARSGTNAHALKPECHHPCCHRYTSAHYALVREEALVLDTRAEQDPATRWAHLVYSIQANDNGLADVSPDGTVDPKLAPPGYVLRCIRACMHVRGMCLRLTVWFCVCALRLCVRICVRICVRMQVCVRVLSGVHACLRRFVAVWV